MTDRRTTWEHRLCSAEQAVSSIEPGESLVFASNHAQPPALIEALVEQRERFEPKVTICTSAASFGVFDHADEAAAPFFRTLLLHPGRLQPAVAEGRAEYLPIDNIELCRLLDQGRLKCDTALVHATPPDTDGMCSLGLSVGPALAIMRAARRVIAQVNPELPRTAGESLVPVSTFDAIVRHPTPPTEWAVDNKLPSPTERTIAANVAELIDDHATLQVGIGSLADAILNGAAGRHGLRIRSGLISDGVMRLAEAGSLAEDSDDPPVHAGSVIGSRDLYQWTNNNPLLRLESTETLHHRAMTDSRFTAINSALDVDLTGQVNVEVLGDRLVGGVGGHLRFMAAAGVSPGGKAILALPSVSRDGRISRIKGRLRDLPVATPRSLIHYVVTEQGVADLQGRTLAERRRALLAVAHPDHRKQLEAALYE